MKTYGLTPHGRMGSEPTEKEYEGDNWLTQFYLLKRRPPVG